MSRHRIPDPDGDALRRRSAKSEAERAAQAELHRRQVVVRSERRHPGYASAREQLDAGNRATVELAAEVALSASRAAQRRGDHLGSIRLERVWGVTLRALTDDAAGWRPRETDAERAPGPEAA